MRNFFPSALKAYHAFDSIARPLLSKRVLTDVEYNEWYSTVDRDALDCCESEKANHYVRTSNWEYPPGNPDTSAQDLIAFIRETMEDSDTPVS